MLLSPDLSRRQTGIATAEQVARMTVGEFGVEVAPYMLDTSPAVLSVGNRCMMLGYLFIWPTGECPYFLLPNCQVCPLVTQVDVPYLYFGKPQSRRKESTQRGVLLFLLRGRYAIVWENARRGFPGSRVRLQMVHQWSRLLLPLMHQSLRPWIRWGCPKTTGG